MKKLFVIVLYLCFFINVPLANCMEKSGSDIVDIVVDYSAEEGRINENVFGVSTNPTEPVRKWAYLKEANFRLIEVNVLVNEKIVSIVTKNPHLIGELPFMKILDDHIKKTYEMGAEPMIWFNQFPKPVRDLKGLALYTEYIIKHVTEGFAGGGKWPIKMLRFGNEPDNPQYWKGTPEEFYKTFTVWSKAVKKINKDFIIVGPGVLSSCERSRKMSLDCSRVNKWMRNYLDYLNNNNGFVDYVTFHGYSSVIYDIYYKQAKLMSNEMKKYNKLSNLFGSPKIGNDEWNVKFGDEWSKKYNKDFDTVSVAAHNIAALTAMIEGGVELSIRYGGTDSPGHDYVMVKKGYKGLKPVYYAFKGFNQLTATPIKLKVLGGSNFLNLMTLAGKSEDGNEMIIVISSFDLTDYLERYEFKRGRSDAFRRKLMKEHYSHALKSLNISEPATYKSFKLNIKNVKWERSDRVEYKVLVVDEKSNLDLHKKKIIPGGSAFLLSGKINTPSVQIIHLKRLPKKD